MKNKTIISLFLILVLSQVAFALDYFKSGVSAYNNGQYKESLSYLYTASAQYPNSVNIRYWYCLALIKNGEVDLARTNYKKIISQSPESQEAKYARIGLKSLEEKLSSDPSLALKHQDQDYIKNMYRNGILYRWPPSAVKVYVAPNINQALAKKAFSEWEKKTSQVITFVFVENPSYAKVHVSFVDKLNKDSFDKTFQAGNCHYEFSGKYISSANIKILTVAPNGQKIPSDVLYATLLHEIGHSIGLLGHSTNPNDVMATASRNVVTSLSQRDVNTAIKLYKSYQTYDQNTLSGAKVNEFKDFASKVPSNPQSWIDLGNSHYQAGQYQQAISSYQKAVKLNSKDASLYINMSAAYLKLNNYQDALGAVKTALSIEPSDSKAMGNLMHIYYKTNQHEQAKASLLSYLKTYPNKKSDKNLTPYIGYYKL